MIQKHFTFKRLIKRDTLQFWLQIKQLVKDDGQSNDAVPFALAARFLLRASAHLSNVASSVVNPFDKLSGKEA